MVVRYASLLARVILTLIVFAFLDRIPDNPGELKERRSRQGQTLKAAHPLDFDTTCVIFVTQPIHSPNICDRISRFDAESTIAFAGIFDLRFAADSSPPASALKSPLSAL